MNKARIIYALALCTVLGIFFGVYQFYFKEKLAAYQRDAVLCQKLEERLKDLEEFFQKSDPDTIVREWRSQVVPWTEAIIDRAKFFTFGDWYEHEKPPKEGGGILKFWYDEQANKLVYDLYQKVGERMGRYDLFPPDIRQAMGAPTLDDLASTDVNEEDVNLWLGRLVFGIKACEMLLEAKASSISQVSLWSMRRDDELMLMQTVGCSFTMTMRDLVKLLEDNLSCAERYFNVNAIRITYPYIGYNIEPQLNVEMVLTQEAFKQVRLNALAEGNIPGVGGPGQGPTAAPGARDAYRTSGMDRSRGAGQTPAAEPGFFGKAWKLFKRYILYTN